MKIYILWKCYGLCAGFQLQDVYKTKEAAEAEKALLESKRDPQDTPEFDTYGQTEGIDYQIEERGLL